VPELQRRGLFHKEYAGPTLRDNLGLPIPRAPPIGTRRGVGWWADAEVLPIAISVLIESLMDQFALSRRQPPPTAAPARPGGADDAHAS
jgi:hypothetical protein